MDMPTVTYWYIVLVLGITPTCGEILYGASIHWRPTNVTNQIVFNYRLVWKFDASAMFSCNPRPGCYAPILSHAFPATKRWAGHRWACTAGCNTVNRRLSNLTDLRYTDVGGFLGDEWEAAVGMFHVTFGTGDDLDNIRVGFQQPNGTLVDSLGEGHIRLASRNDTKRPNISPALNVFPVYRVPLECSLRVRLLPFDGDGDYVKCHWEKFPGTDIHPVLYEDDCEIVVNATTANGFQANTHVPLSVYAEDHSQAAVSLGQPVLAVTTGPFSRTPVKLTVSIGQPLPDQSDCDNGPVFIHRGTPPPGFTHSYHLPFTDAKLPFLLNSMNRTILTTGPPRMVFTTTHSAVNHTTSATGDWNYTTTAEGVWSVSDPNTRGIHQVCGMAYTDDGIPGESRCVILMVEEPDECSVENACTAGGINGTCTNLFDYYTCTYPDVEDNQTLPGNTTRPCQPAITTPAPTTTPPPEVVHIVREKGDNLGLRVGVPVGLSLLLLIVIAATAAYLVRYWREKMKDGAVGPTPGDTGVLGAATTAI